MSEIIRKEIKVCPVCHGKKKMGIVGSWYCPYKHGDGSGKYGILNQPASHPDVYDLRREGLADEEGKYIGGRF